MFSRVTALTTGVRALEMLGKNTMSAHKFHIASVLDEADRLLDMGFHDAVNDIIARLPKQRRTVDPPRPQNPSFDLHFPGPVQCHADTPGGRADPRRPAQSRLHSGQGRGLPQPTYSSGVIVGLWAQSGQQRGQQAVPTTLDIEYTVRVYAGGDGE